MSKIALANIRSIMGLLATLTIAGLIGVTIGGAIAYAQMAGVW
jgi:hypothetical protein